MQSFCSIWRRYSGNVPCNILTLSLQFDTDYEEFKQSVEALKEQLQLFVDSWFEKSLSVSEGRQRVVHIITQDSFNLAAFFILDNSCTGAAGKI
jgi:hypothetical protein